jgi:hypothetical protein
MLAGGNITGASVGTVPAVALTHLDIADTARLELSTQLLSSSIAGIVFDASGGGRFKWVTINPLGGSLSMGHFVGGVWTTDFTTALTVDPNVAHTLKVVLSENVATVYLDDVKVLVGSFTSLLNDGDAGLVTMGGNATFSWFTLATDDPDLRGAALPNVTIDDVSVVEGTGGTKTVQVTVTLSEPSSNPVSVSFDTLDGIAVAGSDYDVATGTLAFAAGETSKTITITIIGDSAFEGDETFLVRLTGASGAVIVDNSALVTILNDDTPSTPTVTVNAVTVNEGSIGTTTVRLVFQLDVAPTSTVSVAYTTVDGTAGAVSDYVAKSGSVTFVAGQTTA